MMNAGANTPSRQDTLKKLSEGLLRSAGHTSVKGNLLEVHHESAPCFDPSFLHRAFQGIGVSIRLSQDGNGPGKQAVRCDSGELPFQDKVFQTVVLHHVVGAGKEPELSEAVRVLARDGVLLLLGLNRLGWRFRIQGSRGKLPGLSPLKVKDRLDELNMTMQGFAGAGLAGLSRPVWMHSGLASLGAPLADIVLMQARHADSPEVTPLRFRNPGGAVVQSAVMRG